MMKSATIYKKEDGLYLHSLSKTTDEVWIASSPFRRIPAGTSTVAVGEAVIEVVEASKSHIEHPSDWSGLFAPMLNLAGARSWKDFKKNARCCGLEMDGDKLRITPQRSLGINQGFEPISGQIVELSWKDSAKQIVEALEKAFALCE